ncbi:hypothetical protein [Larkinella arboricola]
MKRSSPPALPHFFLHLLIFLLFDGTVSVRAQGKLEDYKRSAALREKGRSGPNPPTGGSGGIG